MPAKQPDSMQVVHQPERRRFTILVEGSASGEEPVLEYRLAQDRIAMLHTYVPEAMEGKGVAAALVTAGLEYARAEGLKVQPYCPYVAAFIKKHADTWGDIVAETDVAE